MTVQVVRVGAPAPGAQVIADGPASPAAAAQVGIPRPALGQLTDVAGTRAAPSDVLLGLRKGTDGIFRPEPVPIAETTEWFTGHGPPPPVIPGAGPGDMYIDEGSGTFYQLR